MNQIALRRRGVQKKDDNLSNFTLLYVGNYLVKNTYINRGSETSYNGWSSSDYIDVSGYKYLAGFDSVFMTYTNVYNAYYDINKNPISINNSSGIIPEGAKFFRTSQSTSNMSSCYILLSKEVVEAQTAELFQTDSYVDNGIVKEYTGWNTYKVIPSTKNIFVANNIYQASYYEDGRLFEHSKNMLSVPAGGYALVSNNRNDLKYIPVDEYEYIELKKV